MPDEQRVAMITGGNSGIGFAVASKLAARGFHVILASRNQHRISFQNSLLLPVSDSSAGP